MNITPSLLLIIATLIPMILLIIVYTMQKKQKSARTSVFYMILYANFYMTLFEILNGYILYNVSSKVGLLILRTQWAAGTFCFFACYLYNYIMFKSISDTTDIKNLYKEKNGLKIFTILSCIYILGELFIPVLNFDLSVINFQHIPNMYVAMVYAVTVLFIGFIMFYKKENKTRADYTLLITEIIVAVSYGGLQMLMPDLALSPFLNSAYILVMYIMIENPDIQVSKELEEVTATNDKRGKNAVYFSSSMKKDLIYRINTIKNILIKYKEQGLSGEEFNLKAKNLNYEIKLLTSKLCNTTAVILANEVDKTEVEVELNTFLERFFDLTNSLITKQNVSYKINILGSTPTTVLVDTEYLYYSVLNQFLNALDATEIGEISFTISGETIADQNYVVFKCNDTGKGYSNEEITKINEHIQNNESFELSNAYLALLNELKVGRNGEFSIESFEGAGSITTTKIGYTKVNDSHISDRAITKSEIENNDIFDCNKLKALVLGEPGKRSNDLLKLYNIDVDKTTSSKEALNLIKKGTKYEWFFINITHEDSIAAGKAVKKLNKEYGYPMPYVVAIIPYKNKKYRQMIRESEIFNDYLIEPLEIWDLNTVLRKTRRK